MTEEPDDNDEWELWWKARVEALEKILGKSHDTVGHAVVPFCLGADMGGAADVVYFHHHVPGIVSVTSELIGYEGQQPNDQGTNYELMICHRDDEPWGGNIISRLASYTLEMPLNPGETMDIGPATPEGSTIAAFLFYDYGRFRVRDIDAGLLLCVGITETELEACRDGNREEVEAALQNAGVFPFTDLYRASVI